MDSSELFRNCLLIEDDAGHAKLICRSLKPLVEHFEVAPDIAPAEAALNINSPDLVLCDLKLPGGSGIELISKMHSSDPVLPIVGLTSSDNFQHAIDAMHAGAWDYIVKNFNEDFALKLTLTLTKLREQRERKRAELNLLEERRAYWSAAQSASEGLAITNQRGEIIFANNFFNSFANLVQPNQPVIGNVLLSIIENIDAQAGRRLREHLLNSANIPLWSTELCLKKNLYPTISVDRYFQLTLTQPADLGASNRMVVWVQDITDKKAREKFQRDLLNTTVHDLKGPLGAIVTAVELLSDLAKSNSEEPHSLLIRIASCARGGLTLIDELISASKIQESVMVIKPTWNDFPELISSVLDDFSPVSISRRVKLIFYNANCPKQIFADKLALRRVLTNLVSNGIKFTKPGGSVEIRAWNEADRTQIQIKDTGSGIDPAHRHNLFERFERLDMHAQTEGTGLGLFVVKSIVDAHNGTIELSSELGVGSTFIISLPFDLEGAFEVEAGGKKEER